MNSNYTKHTLKSGLRVIVVPEQSKDVVTTMALVGTGSRYETDDIAGISHVLEHMFYKGTKKRPTSSDISEFIEGLGGEFNAFTSKEYTGFYTKVASKHLEKSLDFISDLLVNPLFDQNELKKEKQVILQEYDMYEDLPTEITTSKFEEALFGKNSLGRDVIGYRKSISGVSRQDIIDYKDIHYRSSNIVLAIAGNITALGEDKLLKMIEELFVFPEGPAKPYAEIKEFPVSKKIIVTNKKIEQTHLAVGFRGVAHNSPDRYTIKILAMILGGSMSSRMFTEIREKRGLAYAVRTTSGNYLDTGMFDTYAGVPHVKVKEAIAAIEDQYRKMTAGVTDMEFQRAREIIFGRMLIALEDTNELANHYAQGELLLRDTLTPQQLIEKYNKITPNDVIAGAAKYFQFEKIALSVVSPTITAEELAKII